MRIKQLDFEDDEGVMLSPLIDCVFLLLVFFLVTSVLKKWETQIRITMPDITTSLADEANEDMYRIAVDRDGNTYFESGRDNAGFILYTPMDDLALFLNDLASRRAPSKPLRLMAERDASFQTVIQSIDICNLQGFENLDLKLSQRLRKNRDRR